MRISKARVTFYRSVVDSGWFDLENNKTILVGPNEAGKSAVLQALQQLSPPDDVKNFNPLRDYPRALYNDIDTGKVDPKDVVVVDARFSLEAPDIIDLPPEYHDVEFIAERRLDNSFRCGLNNAPQAETYKSLDKDFNRLASHADKQYLAIDGNSSEDPDLPSSQLATTVSAFYAPSVLTHARAKELKTWLEATFEYVDEDDEKEEARYDKLMEACEVPITNESIRLKLRKLVPTFVLFNNYSKVKPRIHLANLAQRVTTGSLDDEQYDYGNLCLMKLLGFDIEELSKLGIISNPTAQDAASLESQQEQIDKRMVRLNAASVRLTKEIKKVWNPDTSKGDADNLILRADGQHLKVIVADDLGVEIELDQRSEGFQWLVSFFVTFFAEAQDKHKNAILLLDEPGLSLHALKQREFRETISRLAEENQTIYSTHSPFLVGPNELDMVRVVEMIGRESGTKVHTSITANDPAALLPLQEALGYDLAQSLFGNERNLLCEGLTDYFYVEAISALMGDSGLNKKIAIVPANTASKVPYFATILHAQNLKVAALLDSDAAGDNAANQETLLIRLGNKRILRTKDYETTGVKTPEIEDLLRETLSKIAKDELKWDIIAEVAKFPERPIINIFEASITGFSKLKLAKAFLRWCRENDFDALTQLERGQFEKLISAVNSALK